MVRSTSASALCARRSTQRRNSNSERQAAAVRPSTSQTSGSRGSERKIRRHSGSERSGGTLRWSCSSSRSAVSSGSSPMAAAHERATNSACARSCSVFQSSDSSASTSRTGSLVETATSSSDSSRKVRLCRSQAPKLIGPRCLRPAAQASLHRTRPSMVAFPSMRRLVPLLLCLGCGRDLQPAARAQPPRIASVEPARGFAGDTVTLAGDNLADPSLQVFFDVRAATILTPPSQRDGHTLSVQVPLDLLSPDVSVVGAQGSAKWNGQFLYLGAGHPRTVSLRATVPLGPRTFTAIPLTGGEESAVLDFRY